MNLSDNFALAELTRSTYATRHGINNVPTDAEVLANLEVLAQGLERIRKIVANPVHITSGYRSPKVNAGIGGSRTSDHMKGLAADIHVKGYSALALAKILADSQDVVGAKQIINEFGQWVHVSFPGVDEPPKGEVLTATRTPTGTQYTRGLA